MTRQCKPCEVEWTGRFGDTCWCCGALGQPTNPYTPEPREPDRRMPGFAR